MSKIGKAIFILDSLSIHRFRQTALERCSSAREVMGELPETYGLDAVVMPRLHKLKLFQDTCNLISWRVFFKESVTVRFLSLVTE
jgi:hypothetical protein